MSTTANEIDVLLRQMETAWPSRMVARTDIGRFSGGGLTPRHMANLDSRGEGPPDRIRFGRKIVYPIESLLPWMRSRMIAEPSVDLMVG